ncbi:MAG: TonB-dependent receptor, partial [Opitutaceae bacterium]
MKSKPSIVASLRVFTLLAFAASAAPSFAQSTTSTVSGRVSSSSTGQSLQGVIVRIVGTELRADTTRDGTFELRGVPPGNHELDVSYFGLDAKRQLFEVGAGRDALVNVALGADAVQLDAMRVDASVIGQARAVNQQRTADAMVNITSEELFGETTDNNIAKALQRIPGISANGDGGTEIPRYVNIRGFDGSLNSVQLNGARLPTSGTGQGTVYGETARAFALDDLPANAVTNIEIVKAPTPDMDGDTVGGIVNLVTKSAFDHQGRSFDFIAGMDYIRLREKFVPNFAGTYNDVLMNGRLGVSLSASYFKGDEGFDNIDYDSLPLVPQLPFNQYLNLPTTGIPTFAHEDTEYNNYFIERDRYGFAASIDYKLNDRTTLHFKPVYSHELRDEDDRRYHKIMDNQHGRAASAPPAGAAVGTVYTGTLGRAIVTELGRGVYRTYDTMSRTSATTSLLPNGTGRGQAGYRQSLNEIDLDLYSLDFGGKHELDGGALVWNVFNSRSTKVEVRDSVRFDRNGFQWTYDRPDMKRPDYRVTNGLDPLALPTRGAVDFFANPSSSNVTRIDRDTEETVWQAKADLSLAFPQSTGINGAFKTGVKYRTMERSHDRDQYNWRLANAATFDFAGYLEQSDNTVSGFKMPYVPDTGRIIGEATAGNAAYVADTSQARRLTSLNNDYEASEDSLEGYAMGVMKVGPKLTLSSGVRVEHTWFEASTPVFDAANIPLATRAPQNETRRNDYTKILPGVHLRYEARNNVVFRGAYTHTYGRPAFRETIAVTTFDEINNTIATGNPNLAPYDSENWDFSVEYFGKQASYFQLALFQKSVKNFVLEQTTTLDGASSFNGIPLNPAETYVVSAFSNAHDSVNRGVELAGRYRFVNLPSFFSGLYVDGSITYTDSNGKYADRPGEDLPTYGASEWLTFVGLGYQKDRLSLL